jgi:hypothetical protein
MTCAKLVIMVPLVCSVLNTDGLKTDYFQFKRVLIKIEKDDKKTN